MEEVKEREKKKRLHAILNALHDSKVRTKDKKKKEGDSH